MSNLNISCESTVSDNSKTGFIWKSLKLDYELRKCTLCDSGDIEDEYMLLLFVNSLLILEKNI